jgi:hypothetical protein
VSPGSINSKSAFLCHKLFKLLGHSHTAIPLHRHISLSIQQYRRKVSWQRTNSLWEPSQERDTNRNPPLVQPVNQCNCASAGMHGSTPANEQRGVACGGLRECRPTTNLPTRLGCTAASVKCISMLVVAKAASVAG